MWCEAYSSLIANAGVEVRVRHVDEQVDKHDGRRHEEIHTLHHWVVALKGSIHQKAPHAWQPEDGLDDHRAADDLDDLDTYNGHHRDDGVLDSVLQHHAPFTQTLRPGGADVVLPQHLEHQRPRQAHDAAAWANAQDDGRQEELAEMLPGVHRTGGELQRRRPANP